MIVYKLAYIKYSHCYLDQLLGRGFIGDVIDDDVGSLLGQGQGRYPAQPGSATGHESYFTGKLFRHDCLGMSLEYIEMLFKAPF